MWIPESLPLLLQRLRLARESTQLEVGAKLDIMPGRLSEYERGVRVPSRLHLGALCEFYGEDFGSFVNRSGWIEPTPGRPRSADGWVLDEFAPDTPYYPPRERDFAFRMGVVRSRYSLAWAELEQRLEAVEDPARLRLFVRDLPTDSADEAMYFLHVLGLGATTSLIAPARAGFAKHEIVDCITGAPVGHRRRPAMGLPWGRPFLLFVPHVGVRPQGVPFTMDCTVGVREGDARTWHNVEIDGEGHNPRRDGYRRMMIGLPELRVTPDMMKSPDFAGEHVERLVQQHRELVRRRQGPSAGTASIRPATWKQ